MTDATVFGPKATEQIRKTVREVARMMRNPAPHRGRYTQTQAQDNGARIISFAIVSSDPALRSAQVEIRQRSFPGTVYGSTLEDSVVEVYDTDGCYLNEPNVDLTGRLGKAVLMLVDAEAEAAHFPTGTVPVKYWNVLSLCCPSIVCEV